MNTERPLRSVVVVVVTLLAAVARADVAPPPPADIAPLPTAPPALDAPLVPASVPAAPPAAPPTSATSAPSAPPATSAPPPSTTAKAPRESAVLCGCASSRFLARGALTLDPSTSLAAWLHDGARVEPFARDAENALRTTSLPVDTKVLSIDDGAALVQLRSTGEGAGMLGIVRRRETFPRDVVAVTLSMRDDAVTDDARAPVLDALWLASPEQRERNGCGSWLTLRAAFQQHEGSAVVEAFDVRDVDTGAHHVVDARHAGAFGLGFVPACRHGFPLATEAQTLEVTPVSGTGARGEAWTFRHDGQGLVDVVAVSVPASADRALAALPFPVPGAPVRPFSWVSVGGMWILSALLGLVCGVVGFLFWRFKRRRMQSVRCTSCGTAIPVDVLDNKTDGFFCPSCKKAGVWKGRDGVDVDVTRL